MRTSCLGHGSSRAHLRVERALAGGYPRPRLALGVSLGVKARKLASPKLATTNSDAHISGEQASAHAADPKDAPSVAIPAAQAAPAPQTVADPTPTAEIPAVSPAPESTASSALSSSSSSSPPAPVDDRFAAAWTPPAGEQPLWWVEKFEARRKAEAAKKAQDPSFVTTLERVAPAAAAVGERGDNPALQFLKGALQVVQLLAVLSLLLLVPAALHDGGLSLAKPFTTFAAYLCFFGLGTVVRVVKYGRLAPRQKDRQVATWGGRLAFAAFVVAVPLLHGAAMYRYAGLALYTKYLSYGTTLYDVVGGIGMVLATALNALAARELGASYDRVAAPAALVTTGPYKYVQHPIYTSYVLLFFSYGMWLHSAPTALLMLLVCGLYYRSRTALEAQVLDGAFGSYYRDYASRTKKFVPFVL